MRSCGGVLEGGDDGGEGVGGGHDAGEQQEAAGVSGGLLGLELCTAGVVCGGVGGEGELVALFGVQLHGLAGEFLLFHCLLVGLWLVGEAFAGSPCTQRQGLQFAYQFAAFALTTQHEEYMHSGNPTATGGGSARPAFIFQPLHGKDLLLICVHIFGILFSLLVTITSEQEENYHSITSNASTKLPISKNFFQFAPFGASRWENSATNS